MNRLRDLLMDTILMRDVSVVVTFLFALLRVWLLRCYLLFFCDWLLILSVASWMHPHSLSLQTCQQ